MLEKKNANPNAIAGSNLLDLSRKLLTAAEPIYSEILLCGHCNDIMVDVIADKGCTVVITPVVDLDDNTSTGKPSDIGVLANGGPSDRFTYGGLTGGKIAAPKVQVVVTKVEAGDCAETIISVRGMV